MKVNNKVPPITAAKQISKKLQRKGVVQKSPREEIQRSFFSFFSETFDDNHQENTKKKRQKHQENIWFYW
jgi:hypothetical protein